MQIEFGEESMIHQKEVIGALEVAKPNLLSFNYFTVRIKLQMIFSNSFGRRFGRQ
jgi:hypothetical protein